MRGYPQWRWHLDEAFVKVNGKLCYLWRAVDHEGEVLEAVVTAKRDKAAALKVSQGHHEDTWPTAENRNRRALLLFCGDDCKFVATQPCVVCGRRPSEAHYIRFAQPRALGRKVSDEYTVPVCRLHHRDLHDYGDETSWWAGANIDPLPIALELWRRSRSTQIA